MSVRNGKSSPDAERICERLTNHQTIIARTHTVMPLIVCLVPAAGAPLDVCHRS
jgi:hypothetical protein